MSVIYKASFDDTSRDIVHWRTKGSKNGVRVWQNEDGSYTEAGRNSKPGGRYNTDYDPSKSRAARKAERAAAKTEKRSYGRGQYAKLIKKQEGSVKQAFIGNGKLTAATNDLLFGKMSGADAFKVYGKYALQSLAIEAGVIAVSAIALEGYYNLMVMTGGDMSKAIPMLKNMAATKVGTVANTVKGTAGLGADAVKEFGTQAGTHVGDMVGALKNGVETVDATSAPTSVVVDDFTEWAGNSGYTGNEASDFDLLGLPGEVDDSYFNAMPKENTEYASKIGQQIIDSDYKAPSTTDKIKEAASDFGDKAKTTATEVAGTLKDNKVTKSVSDTFRDWLQAAYGVGNGSGRWSQWSDPNYEYNKMINRAADQAMNDMKQVFVDQAVEAGIYDIDPSTITTKQMAKIIDDQYGQGAADKITDYYLHNYDF